MPFSPDIIVTEPGSSHVLLIVEAKKTASPAQSEPQIKRYMWEMSCPVGLLVSPSTIVLFRNRFTGHTNDSVQKLGEFRSPKSWSNYAGQGSETDFEARVQSWLERLRKDSREPETPRDTEEALSEFIVPSLINGEIHAAGPRFAS